MFSTYRIVLLVCGLRLVLHYSDAAGVRPHPHRHWQCVAQPKVLQPPHKSLLPQAVPLPRCRPQHCPFRPVLSEPMLRRARWGDGVLTAARHAWMHQPPYVQPSRQFYHKKRYSQPRQIRPSIGPLERGRSRKHSARRTILVACFHIALA
jgi:hypothetical protein